MCTKLKHIHSFFICKRMQFSGLGWIFFYCIFKILKNERIYDTFCGLVHFFCAFSDNYKTVISIKTLATGYSRLFLVLLRSKTLLLRERNNFIRLKKHIILFMYYVNRFSAHKIWKLYPFLNLSLRFVLKYSYQKKECTVNLFVQLRVATLMFKTPVEKNL